MSTTANNQAIGPAMPCYKWSPRSLRWAIAFRYFDYVFCFLSQVTIRSGWLSFGRAFFHGDSGRPMCWVFGVVHNSRHFDMYTSNMRLVIFGFQHFDWHGKWNVTYKWMRKEGIRECCGWLNFTDLHKWLRLKLEVGGRFLALAVECELARSTTLHLSGLPNNVHARKDCLMEVSEIPILYTHFIGKDNLMLGQRFDDIPTSWAATVAYWRGLPDFQWSQGKPASASASACVNLIWEEKRVRNITVLWIVWRPAVPWWLK